MAKERDADAAAVAAVEGCWERLWAAHLAPAELDQLDDHKSMSSDDG